MLIELSDELFRVPKNVTSLEVVIRFEMVPEQEEEIKERASFGYSQDADRKADDTQAEVEQ